MIILNYLKPNHFLETFKEITPDFINQNKISLILTDLDGTLAPENELGNSEVREWIKEMNDIGVSIIVVSNNNQGRVEEFIGFEKIEGFGDCKKPMINKIKKMSGVNDREKEEILFLGDQLFTDILCGKRIGVKTAIVKPIPGKETWKTKIKRRPEKLMFRIWGIDK